MRLSLLLAAAILATSCSSREATVREAPPVPAAEVDARGRGYTPPTPLVSPVLALPRPAAYVVALKAALAYFKRVDERDPAAARLVVHDKNGWYGDTDVVIRVQDAGEGRSRVEVSAEGERPRMVLEKYLERLATEVAGDEAMREATAAAQPAATGSGAGTGSATSRP